MLIKSPYHTKSLASNIEIEILEHILTTLIENNLVINKKTPTGLSYFRIVDDSLDSQSEANSLTENNQDELNLDFNENSPLPSYNIDTSYSHQTLPNYNIDTPYSHQTLPNYNIDTPYSHQTLPNYNIDTRYSHQALLNYNINTPYSHQALPNYNIDTPYSHQTLPNYNIDTPYYHQTLPNYKIDTPYFHQVVNRPTKAAKDELNIEATIVFIIFRDILLFYQIFLSPNVKRWAVIAYKHFIYELPNELPRGLRLSILGN